MTEPGDGPGPGPSLEEPARHDGGSSGSSGSSGSPMDALPDEVLVYILAGVPVADLLLRVPRVCRRWSRLSHDAEVWRQQELLYRACPSDAEFGDLLRVVPLPRLARVDLTGMVAGSMAEKSLENAIVEPASELGLKLVLSDEMGCGAAVQLVGRLLGSLVSLHVGALAMKRESYLRLIRLVRDASRLRELRLAATVEMPPQPAHASNRDHADWERQDTLQRLVLWSDGGEMSPAMQAGACCVLRTNSRSLRFVSHEYMSSKRPPAAQERRIMDAIAKCSRLQGARVWSSHRLKLLEDCGELTSLTLSCDGECHRRLEPDLLPAQDGANQGAAGAGQQGHGPPGHHQQLQQHLHHHLQLHHNHHQQQQLQMHFHHQPPALQPNLHLLNLNLNAHLHHHLDYHGGVFAVMLGTPGPGPPAFQPLNHHVGFVVHANVGQQPNQAMQPLGEHDLDSVPLLPASRGFQNGCLRYRTWAPSGNWSCGRELVVVHFGELGMQAGQGVIMRNASHLGLVGLFIPSAIHDPHGAGPAHQGGAGPAGAAMPLLPEALVGAGPVAYVVVAGGTVVLIAGPHGHVLVGRWLEPHLLEVLGEGGPISFMYAGGQGNLVLNWLHMMQQAVEQHRAQNAAARNAADLNRAANNAARNNAAAQWAAEYEAQNAAADVAHYAEQVAEFDVDPEDPEGPAEHAFQYAILVQHAQQAAQYAAAHNAPPPQQHGQGGPAQAPPDPPPQQAPPGPAAEEPFTCVELFTESVMLSRLRRLCLRLLDCNKVSPLHHIAARCPDLEELTLHCLHTDSHLNANLHMLRNLRCLTLIGVHYLHPDTLQQWTEDTLPSLQRLTLIGANRMPCPWKCWAGPVLRLRAMRPNLAIAVKKCKHFDSAPPPPPAPVAAHTES